MVADAFVAAHKGSWLQGGLADTCELTVAAVRVLVTKPRTYMNLSGRAIALFAAESSVPASRIIAVTDEYNFPTGRIHLKRGGSNGGHNGIASIIDELRTPEFWRLRCGIDRKFGPGELVEYVLAPFTRDERDAVELMIRSAVTALDECLRQGPEIAMNRINRA
jgi:PTH1 family peptidyl-tRNA hydrolase